MKYKTSTSSGNKLGCLENILSLKSLYLQDIKIRFQQLSYETTSTAKRSLAIIKIAPIIQITRLKKCKQNEENKPYVPVTSFILSIARSLICEASKYLSSSARVLKWYRNAVAKRTESRPFSAIRQENLPRCPASRSQALKDQKLTSIEVNRAV